VTVPSGIRRDRVLINIIGLLLAMVAIAAGLRAYGYFADW